MLDFIDDTFDISRHTDSDRHGKRSSCSFTQTYSQRTTAGKDNSGWSLCCKTTLFDLKSDHRANFIQSWADDAVDKGFLRDFADFFLEIKWGQINFIRGLWCYFLSFFSDYS